MYLGNLLVAGMGGNEYLASDTDPSTVGGHSGSCVPTAVDRTGFDSKLFHCSHQHDGSTILEREGSASYIRPFPAPNDQWIPMGFPPHPSWCGRSKWPTKAASLHDTARVNDRRNFRAKNRRRVASCHTPNGTSLHMATIGMGIHRISSLAVAADVSHRQFFLPVVCFRL